ncbi:MAG: triose-phosphate isomerase [Patescibacteria group bacterium]
MKKILVANWKMNPETTKKAVDLYSFISEVLDTQGNKLTAIVCPPFVYLEPLSKISFKVFLGAQNCHWEYKLRRAFTGEISVVMLKNLDVKYVIIGHSERRWIMMEDDRIINKKIKAALKNYITPIFCVGERTKKENSEKAVKSQIKLGLAGIDSKSRKKLLVAYEPAWAIGSNEPDDPKRAAEVIKLIKKLLPSSRVLYGGSVNSLNAADFMARPEIDGVMVGGASNDKIEIQKIIEISSKLSQ